MIPTPTASNLSRNKHRVDAMHLAPTLFANGFCCRVGTERLARQGQTQVFQLSSGLACFMFRFLRRPLLELRRETSGAERDECARLTAWDYHTTGAGLHRALRADFSGSRYRSGVLLSRSKELRHRYNAAASEARSGPATIYLFHLDLWIFRRTAVLAMG
jgi:hypothetical protein